MFQTWSIWELFCKQNIYPVLFFPILRVKKPCKTAILKNKHCIYIYKYNIPRTQRISFFGGVDLPCIWQIFQKKGQHPWPHPGPHQLGTVSTPSSRCRSAVRKVVSSAKVFQFWGFQHSFIGLLRGGSKVPQSSLGILRNPTIAAEWNQQMGKIVGLGPCGLDSFKNALMKGIIWLLLGCTPRIPNHQPKQTINH